MNVHVGGVSMQQHNDVRTYLGLFFGDAPSLRLGCEL
jgi:hypothetical protein